MGLDGVALILNSTDPVEHLTAMALAEEIAKFRELEREDLAVLIINRLSDALKG